MADKNSTPAPASSYTTSTAPKAHTALDPIRLEVIFQRVNLESFDDFLEVPRLQWNSRLRSSAGRFVPSRRSLFKTDPPIIEIASYLLEEPQAYDLIYDTMAHEMIHYWLWVRRKPYGHTHEFLAKMKVMGVSRYNSVPRTRPYKYLYKCPSCQKGFPAKRKLGSLACAICCKKFSQGRFDARFKLVLHESAVQGVLSIEREQVPEVALSLVQD